MIDPLQVVLFASALLASTFMAWTIGAGSAGSTPFAPAVGARAISTLRAGLTVGVCILLGAVFQGANVSEAVGRELVGGIIFSPAAAALALLIAALLVTIGVFTGYPIATAFTVTGAVIGVGLAAGGAPNWAKYAEIAILWLTIPFVGGAISYAIARWLRADHANEARAIAILGGIVGMLLVNIEFAVLGDAGEGETIALAVAAVLPGQWLVGWTVATGLATSGGFAVVRRQVSVDLTRAEQRFTVVMGAIVAFSAGGSQVGLAVGPLVPLLDGLVPLSMILAGGGIGLLIGAWTGAPRLIKALSQDYAQLGPRRALAALLPAFAIAQVAILLGVPVSFNQIIVSGVAGAGAAAHASGGISRRKIRYTVLAWTLSFVGSFVIGFASGWLIVGSL